MIDIMTDMIDRW